MKLEIWADFCDPFSCLGVKTLRAAMAQLGVEKFFEIEMKSYDAHRLSKFARARGVDMTGSLFDACFRDGRDLSDHAVLKSLAEEAGLGGKDTESVLNGSDYASDVRRDEDEAARFGIRAVPYFGVDRTYGISGMKSLTLFRYALKDLLRKANIGYTSPAVENDGE